MFGFAVIEVMTLSGHPLIINKKINKMTGSLKTHFLFTV